MIDNFTNLNFSSPYLLLLGLLPLLLLVFSKVFESLSSNTYCDKDLLKWVTITQKVPFIKKIIHSPIISITTWILFSIALAGPRINIDERLTETITKPDKAIAFVLDLSQSMLSEDIYPNRIAKAKLTIEALTLTSSGYLYSLIVFSENAHIATPLTYDKNVILDTLDALKPNMLPVAGSNVVSGLKLASKILSQSDTTTFTIFIISDGDFSTENNADNTLFKNMHVSVNSIGIGTSEGQPIPDKKGSWLTYKNKTVISKLNKLNLKQISDKYNGRYINGNKVNTEELTSLLPRNRINKLANSEHTFIIWQQLYQWFLIPAVFLLLLTTIKYNQPTKKNTTTNINKYFIIILASLIISLTATDSAQASELTTAETLYQNKNYIKAELAYKQAEGFHAALGQANSVYKQKNFQKALHLFNNAIQEALNDQQRAMAIFNLANTYYTIGDYSQAIKIYNDALLYNPTFEQAKVNLEYAIIVDKKVKRAIALRLGKNKSINPGSGPRSEKIEDGVAIGDSKVILSDDEPKKQKLYSFNIPDNVVNKLIHRGIKHSIISNSKIDTHNESSQWEYEHTTLDMIELLIKEEKTNNYALWKRLFEIEAGFPAPVESPHIKPGVTPW